MTVGHDDVLAMLRIVASECSPNAFKALLFASLTSKVNYYLFLHSYECYAASGYLCVPTSLF